MDNTKKYIGESPIKENPQKKLKIKLTDGAVTTDKIADKSVSLDKLAEEVTNVIQGSTRYVPIVAQELGDNNSIGISQKKLTEEINRIDDTLSTKQENLTFDDAPESGSQNPVTSDGIHAALSNKADKSDTYTKAEVNERIVPHDSSLIVVQTLPATGNANTIYRLYTSGGSSYSDYMYVSGTGPNTGWIQLAEYNNAIDEDPVKNSQNLVTSGGVYKEQKRINDCLDSRTLKRGAFICQTSSTANANGRLSEGGTLESMQQDTYKWKAAKLPDSVNAGDTIWIESKNNNTLQSNIAFRVAFFSKAEGEDVNVGDSYIPGSYFVRIINKNDTTKYVDYVVVPEGATHICVSNYYEGTASNKTAYTYAYLSEYRIDTLEIDSATAIENIWWERKAMAGYFARDVVMDTRTEIDGEPNPNYGKTTAYASSNRLATNYLPLLECTKIKIFCQLTSASDSIYGIDGVIAYDKDKNPLPTPIYTVIQGESATYGWLEIDRPADAEYIRYSVPFATNSLNDMNIVMRDEYTNVITSTNIKEKVTQNSLFTSKKVVITRTSTDDGVIGELAVRLSDGANYGNIGDHVYAVVPAGAKYVIAYAKIIHNSVTNNYLGGVALDAKGNVLGVLYKMYQTPNGTSGVYSENICMEIPDNTYSIKFTIADGVASRNLYFLTPATKDEKAIKDSVYDETLEYIHQAKYRFASKANQQNTVLGLMHFSDWHGDIKGAKMLLDWADRIRGYGVKLGYYYPMIHDVLNTGDVVVNDLTTSDAQNYFKTELPQKALLVLGNHEMKGGLTGAHDDAYYFNLTGAGEQEATQDKTARERTVEESHKFTFNTYFSDYISGWGVTMPEGYDDENSPYYQACYWHKDYASQGIRLIAVDCMYRFDGILKKVDDGSGSYDFEIDSETNLLDKSGDGLAHNTTEQETWLYRLLQDTLPGGSKAGYHVVIAAHVALDEIPRNRESITNFEYSITNPDNFIDTSVNMRNREVYTHTTYGYKMGTVNNMGDIVQNFINKGGKFVAWLGGHTHVSHFFYSDRYPDILNVVIEKAGNGAGGNGTADRSYFEPSRIAANYLAIDRTNSLLKIIRLGLTVDRNLRERKYLCYDYKNKRVISSDSGVYKTIYASDEPEVLTEATASDSMSQEITDYEKSQIPSYFLEVPETPTVEHYNPYLEEKIQSIPDGKHFIFITDAHWRYNCKKFPAILNYVRKRTGIPFIIFGGDAIHRPANYDSESVPGSGIWTMTSSSYVTPAQSAVRARQELSKFCTEMKEKFGEYFLYTLGNHDLGLANLEGSGWSSSSKDVARVTYQDIIKETQSSLKRKAVYDEDGIAKVDLLDITDEQKAELKAYIKQCYYVDDPQNKMRYIITCTGQGNGMDGAPHDLWGLGGSRLLCSQVRHIGNALITLPKDYDVLVVGHELATAQDGVHGGTTWILELLDAYRGKTSFTIPYPADSLDLYRTWRSKWSSRTCDFSNLTYYGRVFFMEGHRHVDRTEVMTFSSRWHASLENYNTQAYPYSENEAQRLKQYFLITVRRDGTTPTGRSSIPGTTSSGGTIDQDCAFDVVTLTDDSKVICTRFGYGSDKERILPEFDPNSYVPPTPEPEPEPDDPDESDSPEDDNAE